MSLLARLAPVAAALLLSVPCTRAQGAAWTARSDSIARAWRTVDDDSLALQRLSVATREHGSAPVLAAVLDAVGNPGRPVRVRIEALDVAMAFVDPHLGFDGMRELPAEPISPQPACRPSERWVPGDTLASCVVRRAYRRHVVPWSSTSADYTAAVSVEPTWRDSIRLRVHRVATSDPHPGVRQVAEGRRSAVGGDDLFRQEAIRECRARRAADPRAWWEALGGRASCRLVWGEAIAEAWRTARDSSTWRMRYAASGLRDTRVEAALREVAADGARPATLRIEALEVLATLGHPRAEPQGSRFAEGGWLVCEPWGYHVNPRIQDEGIPAMGVAGRARVLRFLRARAAAEPHPRVRRAARFLAGCLARLAAEKPVSGR